MSTFLRLPALALALAAGLLFAADTVQFQPSKINYAKKKGWEPLASKWMDAAGLEKFVEAQKKANKQLIFVEYNGAQWRGLFSDKISYRGWYWHMLSDKASMASTIAKHRKEGFEPSYVFSGGGFYTAVFVSPLQMKEARAILDELGIGEPAIK